jgi:hypothetical protein
LENIQSVVMLIVSVLRKLPLEMKKMNEFAWLNKKHHLYSV